jgi:hypothetical protein
MDFKVGDIVAFRASFLRSVGWFTDVPRNGRVVAVTGPFSGHQVVTAEWCDGNTFKTLDTNLLHFNRLHLEAK